MNAEIAESIRLSGMELGKLKVAADEMVRAFSVTLAQLGKVREEMRECQDAQKLLSILSQDRERCRRLTQMVESVSMKIREFR